LSYAILVSALCAIVATAFAMFGLHSWLAIKTAPFVGGALGFCYACLSLGLHRLSLTASLEEYRAAAGIVEVTPILPIHMSLAFGAAFGISILESSLLLLSQGAAFTALPLGWIVMILYVLARVSHRPDTWPSGRLDIFQAVGALACLGMCGGVILGTPLLASQPMPTMAVLRTIGIVNSFAALGTAIVTIFGLALFQRAVAMIDMAQR